MSQLPLHWWKHGTVVLAIPLLALALAGAAPSARAVSSGPRVLAPDSVPAPVRNGTARLVGAHAANDRLHVLFALPMRDWAGLKAFLADVGNPASAHYGQYLTQEQANARFNPDPAHEARVVAWLQAAGAKDVQTQPNHLYVGADATVATLDRLLGIAINDYTAGARTFYALDRPPALPAVVAADVDSILGLSNAQQFHTYLQTLTNGVAHGHPPYYPQDLANAYDVNPLWNSGFTGANMNIAIVLWGAPSGDAALTQWAATTHAAVATRANGRLQVIPVDSGSSYPDQGEAALDIEASGGIAYQAHIRYYEAPTDSGGRPLDTGLADALNAAGSDPTNPLISDSWGGPEDSGSVDFFDHIFAANTATGHNYLFSSGDNGSWSDPNGAGVDPWPDYPTSSAYVTAVGGTRFAGNIGATWPGEGAWQYGTDQNGNPEGSGGGFSNVVGRPAWQVGPGTAGAQRGYPDVAALADPGDPSDFQGFFACYDGGCVDAGGTSLSCPLWAGMLTLIDQYRLAHGQGVLGFPNPVLYQLAVSAAHPAFHDITSGTNGAYDTGPGWDAVTGLGSPDLNNLLLDLAPAPPPTPVPTSTPVPTPTRVPGQIFNDVPPANPFYTQINWAYAHHLISGYGDNTFRPNNNATRAQVGKIITLAAGWPLTTAGGPHFTDDLANPFYAYIETAYNRGAISGYADHTFRPYNNITRGQFSKVLVTAKAWAPDTAGGPHFRDVPATNPFYSVIETAYNHGVISGYADHTFRPNTNITRGQLAKLLYGAYGP